MVLLAPSSQALQMKLRRLQKYFTENLLEVNQSKTNVAIFRRGGRPPKVKFTYKNQPIQITSEYTYLDVPFSSSCLFSKAAKYFKEKGKVALGQVWKIASSSRMEPVQQKHQLFNALASSTTLYCSHIWGLRYATEIKKKLKILIYAVFSVAHSTPPLTYYAWKSENPHYFSESSDNCFGTCLKFSKWISIVTLAYATTHSLHTPPSQMNKRRTIGYFKRKNFFLQPYQTTVGTLSIIVI